MTDESERVTRDVQDIVLSVGRRRILDRLKLGGPATPAELARELHLTPAAVRQHLDGLAEEDLVSVSDEHTGTPGRPAGRWRLTRRAHGLFPDRHGELTAALVQAIRSVAGDEVLNEVIALRTRDQQRDYETAVAAAGQTLRDRTEALARMRTAEGYMAEVTKEEGGDGLLLIEHHCPICEAAESCAGFCRAELGVFRAVLGDDVTVERTEHLLAGAPRCAYRICASAS
ncbi:MAG: helix-turn-helix domain-containing protein [Acidimicrobiales bacterium]